MSAIISPDGRFRYLLTRGDKLSPDSATCGIVMLNPSTADAEVDDPTIRKLTGFTKDWGYSAFVVANCYAFRATKPDDLRFTVDPIGPHNDSYLHVIASLPLIVVAWGKEARPARAAQVEKILRSYNKPLFCLGTNIDGSPRHPLYVPYSQRLVEWLPNQTVTCK